MWKCRNPHKYTRTLELLYWHSECENLYGNGLMHWSTHTDIQYHLSCNRKSAQKMIIAGCCSKPSHVLVLLANEIRWSMEHKNISTNDEVKQTNSHSALIAPNTPSQKWYEIVQFPFVLSTTTTVVLIIMVLAMAFRVYEKKRFAVYWWYKSMSLGRRGIKSKNLSLFVSLVSPAPSPLRLFRRSHFCCLSRRSFALFL